MQYIILIFFLALSVTLSAQQADSARHTFDAKMDSIKRKTSSTDSLLSEGAVIDQILKSRQDSLAAVNAIEAFATTTQNKIDSLSALNLPTDKYEKSLDSLATKYPDIVTNKIKEWENKAKNKIEGVRQDIDAKILKNRGDDLTGKMPDEVNSLETPDLPVSNPLPGDVGDIDIPANEIELPGQSGLGKEAENLKPKIDNPVEEELDDVKGKVEEVKDKPNEKLATINEVEQAKEHLKEAKEIEGELKNAKQGDISDLEKRGEAEILERTSVEEELAQTEEFEKMRSQLDEQKALGEKYQDPEFVKQRIMEKSRHVSNDILAKYKEEIALAKSKASFNAIKDLEVDTLLKAHDKPRPYKLKNRKFRDRAYIGAIWEITNIENKTRLDLSPVFGYKYNQKLTLWGSYMYRIRLDKDAQSLDQNNTVYGPRLGISYDIWKGFYARSTAEFLRVSTRKIDVESQRKWKEGIYMGFGKDYKISKHVNGDMQVLYNLTYERQITPFANKFNFRFGFYVDFAKRPPKPEWKKEIKKL